MQWVLVHGALVMINFLYQLGSVTVHTELVSVKVNS